MKTRSLKLKEINKEWILIDAKDLVLGRLSSLVAMMLKGKNKPTYTPHMDCGDNIVIINAEKIHLTGKKYENKKFYWHTGYPGGIKEKTIKERMKKNPTEIIYTAVERMLSKGPLRNKIMKNLKIYKGEDHAHLGQNPKLINIGNLNSKNKRR